MNLENSLYGQYVFERLNAKILEIESGFIVYNYVGKDFYIIEFFIKEESRMNGWGRALLEELYELALVNGSAMILAQIFLSDKHASQTLCGALKCGFKISQANNNIISIYKEVGG